MGLDSVLLSVRKVGELLVVEYVPYVLVVEEGDDAKGLIPLSGDDWNGSVSEDTSGDDGNWSVLVDSRFTGDEFDLGVLSDVNGCNDFSSTYIFVCGGFGVPVCS